MHYDLPGKQYPYENEEGKRKFDEALRTSWQHRILVRRVMYSDANEEQAANETPSYLRGHRPSAAFI